ncbi:hypothetical protein K227x_29190 [Rubripirellula lacrimiformis]|uniref:DUF1570 domain-containing protein n=1 Tax=Rubripirellula lacrimiformis TaxID=1930273 RepID=A0A517NBL6_9BACT|nr:DUF1570 domain-containing protein [Rubripirellula lacrimiformis]QDT04527.1 hypothetical protein K227x_29190 [Rubripirellula lacrimiformis]
MMPRLVLLAFTILLVMPVNLVDAVETVQFTDGKVQRSVSGEVMIEAQNGDVMIQADDGRIWTIEVDQVIQRKSDQKKFQPIGPDEAAKRLIAELGDDFSVYRTANYAIVYNCDDGYARAVGGLFEKLYRGFFTYWKNQRWRLPEPRFPLVAVVLKDHSAFLNHAGNEIGDRAKSVIGYYNLSTNQMTTFNMPNWERNVATIIHEATHQLAYNCGLQTRFADNPMWVSEGLATFFETPDMRNPGQWRSIGGVNRVNLGRWHRYVPNRPAESLATLLADDTRFLNQATADAAYAEGWALTYFLIQTKREEYVDYLRKLSEGKPAVVPAPRERIQLFEESFGMTLVELDRALVKYMRRVRP